MLSIATIIWALTFWPGATLAKTKTTCDNPTICRSGAGQLPSITMHGVHQFGCTSTCVPTVLVDQFSQEGWQCGPCPRPQNCAYDPSCNSKYTNQKFTTMHGSHVIGCNDLCVPLTRVYLLKLQGWQCGTCPAGPTTLEPTPLPGISIYVADFYISYAVSKLRALPSQATLDELLEVTKEFFTKVFDQYFSTRRSQVSFQGLEMSYGYPAVYDAGFPSSRYNLWTDPETYVYFGPDSNPVPTSDELFAIMNSTNLDPYVSMIASTIKELASTTSATLAAFQLPPQPVTYVAAPDYYIAYVVPALKATPSQQVIDKLNSVTKSFYAGLFDAAYGATSGYELETVSFSVFSYQFGAGIPEARYNLNVDFVTVLSFNSSGLIPTPQDITNVMTATTADYTRYITDYVRTVPQLVSTNEVIFELLAIPAPVTPFALDYYVPGLASTISDAFYDQVIAAMPPFLDPYFTAYFANSTDLVFTDLNATGSGYRTGPDTITIFYDLTALFDPTLTNGTLPSPDELFYGIVYDVNPKTYVSYIKKVIPGLANLTTVNITVVG